MYKRQLWHRPLWLVVGGAAVFLTVDLAFFAANLTKVLHGGWFPLTIAAAVFVLLKTWQQGREIVTRNRIEEEGPLREFVDGLREREPPVERVARAGIFLNASPETTPLALRANVEHNNVVHACVVIVSIRTLRVPHVPPADVVTIDDLGYGDDGISHVTARLGFQDETDVPAIVRMAASEGLEGAIHLDEASFFLSRMTIVPTDAPGMARWRKKLFMAMARNASDPVLYFRLPDERTVVMGSHVKF